MTKSLGAKHNQNFILSVAGIIAFYILWYLMINPLFPKQAIWILVIATFIFIWLLRFNNFHYTYKLYKTKGRELKKEELHAAKTTWIWLLCIGAFSLIFSLPNYGFGIIIGAVFIVLGILHLLRMKKTIQQIKNRKDSKRQEYFLRYIIVLIVGLSIGSYLYKILNLSYNQGLIITILVILGVSIYYLIKWKQKVQ